MTDQALAAEQHRATLGHFDSSTRRTRKGRSTFRVNRRHVRWVTGPDPIRETVEGLTMEVGDVRLTGGTIADLADAWVRAFHPEAVSERHGGAATCTCDDLTHPAVVLDRSEGFAPVYDPSTGRYQVREVPVRACHCGFPRMLGTDMGLSYAQLGPGRGKLGADYLTAYTGRDRARRAARARIRRHVARVAEAAPWADVEAALRDALAATAAPTVEVTSFPDVTVAIRRTAPDQMRVVMTRGAETLRFRARTVGAIARRVVA